MGQDAAVEKCVELVFDELGQACPRLELDLGKKGGLLCRGFGARDSVFGESENPEPTEWDESRPANSQSLIILLTLPMRFHSLSFNETVRRRKRMNAIVNGRPVPKRHATDYIGDGNLYLTAEGDERMLTTVIEVMGEDQVCVSADIPQSQQFHCPSCVAQGSGKSEGSRIGPGHHQGGLCRARTAQA